MNDDVELPWPQCLGAFDEESCRFYLHEIGKRVVPFFPFAIGIEEVYASILERYGLEGSKDATSVLQELLEDGENASGVGDDGDIWRSWRHNWRHRSDDKLNPFMPRVGNQFLPVPTAARIRRYRAANFANQQLSARGEAYTPGSVSSTRDIRTDRVTTELFGAQDIGGEDTNLGFEEPLGGEKAPFRPAPDLVPALRLSLQALEHLKSCPRDTIELRGGDSAQDTNLPVLETRRSQADEVAMPLNASRKHSSPVPKVNKNFGQVVSGGEHSVAGEFSTVRQQECQSAKTAPGNSLSLMESNISSVQRRRTGSGIAMTTKSGPSGSPVTPKTKRRILHRQARLIDGTISTFASTDTGNHESSSTPRTNQAFDSPKAVIGKAVELHQELTERPNRRSWRGLKSLFRGSRLHLPHRSSSRRVSIGTLSPITSVGMADRSMAAQDSPAGHRNVQSLDDGDTSPITCYDGTFDESPYSGKTRMDLNKPLPLNPEDVIRSSQSDAGIASLVASQIFTSSLSTASSSPFSKASQKFSTYSLSSDKAGYQSHTDPELVTVSEAQRGTHSGQRLPKLSNFSIPLSRANSVHGCATEEDQISVPTVPLPSLFGNFDGTSDKKDRAKLPLSQSEPTLQFKTAPENGGSHRHSFNPSDGLSICDIVLTEDGRRLANGHALMTSSHRVPAQRENSTPIKRPRSPFKRLLGLGKAEVLNEDEPRGKRSQTKILPTASGKKSSIQKWGDRFRNGFLTADEEQQLRQEQNIEQYMAEFEPSPLSMHNVEVSLEPPQQAKVQSELELMIAVTANRYLLGETMAGRLSIESIVKIKDQWAGLGRHRVTNFHYDLSTQHYLVMLNLRTVKFYGPAATDPIQINSILYGWKLLAKSMAVRSFCHPDSVIRKHLHDARRVLELLGAPSITFTSFDDLQLKTLARISINESQGRKHEGNRNFSMRSRRTLSETTYFPYSTKSFQMEKINLAPSPPASPAPSRAQATTTTVPPVPFLNPTTYTPPIPSSTPRRPTGAETAFAHPPSPTHQLSMKRTRPHHKPATFSSRTPDEYHGTRGGRLGKAIREKPEDVLLSRGHR